MKRVHWQVGISAIVVLILSGYVGYHFAHRGVPEAQGNTVEPADAPSVIEEPVATSSSRYVPSATIPQGWEAFPTASKMERLNMVTEAMDNHQLPNEVQALLKAELYNRDHWDVTRNNMANALVWQEKPDPTLHQAFIQMLEDETEDPVWRDYCLQFLSECLASTSDPDLVKATLAKYAQGKDDLAGTAVIHLAYQEGEGRYQPDAKFSAQLERQLADPTVTVDTRMSILGVIGKRKDTRLLPLVRTYAKSDNAGLRRCAIASLGLMGAQEDLPLIQAGLSDSNRAVQMAATAAQARLQERLTVSREPRMDTNSH